MQPAKMQKVRIWDIWIRCFHWSLVATVLFLLFSGETGWQFYEWHRYAGEFVIFLLMFRIGWSMVGSSNASLPKLIVAPKRALLEIRNLVSGKTEAHRGHDAAGGWAVLALLLLISIQAITGIFIADEEELIEGAFYGGLSTQQTDWLLRIHHLNAGVLQLLVLLHVVVILAYAVRAGRNLLTPMITGFMRWPDTQKVVELRFQRPWIGLLLMLFCALVVGVLFSWV